MRGEVQRIEESIDALMTQLPLVHLAFLHIKILSDTAAEALYSNDLPVIDAALRLVSILRSDQYMTSPLKHHIIALAAGTLALAIDLDASTITDALNDLRQVCETSRLHPAWRSSISHYIDSQLQARNTKTPLGGANNRDSLQHLADAAVGADHTAFEKVDWSTITSRGYLRAFE